MYRFQFLARTVSSFSNRTVTARRFSTTSTDAVARKLKPDSHFLIIGGAQGIGSAVAEALLALPKDQFAGKVSITTRNPSSVTSAAILQKAHAIHQMDAAAEPSVRQVAETVSSDPATGTVDVLINCCGLLHDQSEGRMPEKALAEFDLEWFMRSMLANAAAHGLVMKHFSPLMHRRPNEPFSIIANVSARVGSIEDNGLGGWHSYRASKSAQNQLSRTAAIELRRKNIAVLSYHPGTVETSLSEPWQKNVKPGKLFTREQAAGYLLRVLDGLDRDVALPAKKPGLYLDWDGKAIPW